MIQPEPLPSMEIIRLHDGTPLQVHPRRRCNPEGVCCIHNPSNHPLADAPRDWSEATQMMYRICPHGYGHPDRDDLKVRTWPEEGKHTCDGCCCDVRAYGLIECTPL